MVVLAMCALLLIVPSTLGPSEGCILPGNINGRYVGKQPGDVLEEGQIVKVQCDAGTTDRVNGRLRCMFPTLDRRLPFCTRDCKLEAGDRLLIGTNFRQSAPLVLHHQYSVTLQCQEGYGSTTPLLSVSCEDGTLTQRRDLAFCTNETSGTNMSTEASSSRQPPPADLTSTFPGHIPDCSVVGSSSVYNRSGSKIRVYCQVDETGKWTVIQRRKDGSVSFNKRWLEYRKSFGDPAGEFWLGNDYIHDLTSAGLTTLRVNLEDWEGVRHTVYYSMFSVARVKDKFGLNVSGFNGSTPPGDSLQEHNGMKFTTTDRDNDMSPYNCASSRREGGGWWYSGCASANLNGVYNSSSYSGVYWKTWRGYYSLKAVTMMLKKP